MTMPDNPTQFLDPNNKLLSPCPASLDTGSVGAPGQPKMGVLTIRTNSTTLTVLMGGEDLRTWADLIGKLADAVDGGAKKLVPATAMDVAVLDNTMKVKKK